MRSLSKAKQNKVGKKSVSLEDSKKITVEKKKHNEIKMKIVSTTNTVRPRGFYTSTCQMYLKFIRRKLSV